MGQTMSEPLVTKTTSTKKNKKLLAVSTCMQGWRDSMEDAHVLTLSVPEDESASFFGVFDGHGGSTLAQHVSEHIQNKVFQQDCYKQGNIADAMVKAHLALDYEMSYDQHLRDDTSGTTSITVLMKNNTIYCANIGDSRALVSVVGHPVELSHDHKPSDQIETERILGAGGFVEFNRVNGNLALSRAFGDFIYKRNSTKSQEQQIITANPDIVTEKITSEHEFLILACDGIWDVMTNYEVIRFIRTRIAKGISVDKICEELLNTCLAPDCRMSGLGCDNMTVVLVCFLNGRPYSELSSRCSKPAVNNADDSQSAPDNTIINNDPAANSENAANVINDANTYSASTELSI